MSAAEFDIPRPHSVRRAGSAPAACHAGQADASSHGRGVFSRESLLALQRSAGNAAVAALVAPPRPTRARDATREVHSQAPESRPAGSRQPFGRGRLHVPRAVLQRQVTVADTLDAANADALQQVLGASTTLNTIWEWFGAHPWANLTVQPKAEGSSAFTGDRPRDLFDPGFIAQPVHGTVALRPPATEAAGLETLSHELNLHFLPWARLLMYKDAAAIIAEIGSSIDVTYPVEQQRRIAAVLGEQDVDLQADAANVYLQQLGGIALGNHADIGLWLTHVRTITALVHKQRDERKAAAIAATAINKMNMPMLLTGAPETTILRRPALFEAFVDEFEVLTKLAGAHDDILAGSAKRIRQQVEVYRRVAEGLPQGRRAAYLEEYASQDEWEQAWNIWKKWVGKVAAKVAKEMA